MYPKQHAVVSTAATGLYALFSGVSAADAVVWAITGGVAGVLIDVDHALLSMLIRGRVQQGVYWFRHPVEAVMRPDRFLDEMDYDGLLYHRLLSHTIIFGVLIVLLPAHWLFTPVAVGVAAHIAADVVYDTYTGNYTQK